MMFTKLKIGMLILGTSALCVAEKPEKPEEPEPFKVGEPMPEAVLETKMKNIDGEMLTLKKIGTEKKGTLVIFSCRHCPFVVAWDERMAAIGNEYQKKDIGVVFINPNDPVAYPRDNFENMQEQAEQHGYEFPYVVDATSDVARAFEATRTPEVFLFDAERKLVYKGAIDDSPRNPENVKKQYLRDALDALLAGEEIEPAKTRSIGCTIKFRKQPDEG